MTYGQRMLDLVKVDPRVMVLTAENWGPIVPVGLSRASQFIDTGITEQTLVGIAVGLALRGRIPFVHAHASFLTMRAYEFVRTDVGIGKLPVKLIGSLSGLLSEANGPTHQAIEDLALMQTIPNMRIFCPATEEELINFLPMLVGSSFPWYIRFNDKKSRHPMYPVVEGKATIIGQGGDVGIVTCGFLVEEAISAMQILSDVGISSSLMNLRFLRPFDTEALIGFARRSTILVTVEDHFSFGGIGELIIRELFSAQINMPLVRIALNDWFSSGILTDVLDSTGMSAIRLAERIQAILKNELHYQRSKLAPRNSPNSM